MDLQLCIMNFALRIINFIVPAKLLFFLKVCNSSVIFSKFFNPFAFLLLWRSACPHVHISLFSLRPIAKKIKVIVVSEKNTIFAPLKDRQSPARLTALCNCAVVQKAPTIMPVCL